MGKLKGLAIAFLVLNEVRGVVVVVSLLWAAYKP